MYAARDRGQVLLEFTLALGFAFTLIFGIIDFGRAIFAHNLVTSAAALGSRYAVVRGSSCSAAGCTATGNDVQTYVRGKSPGVDASLLTVTTTWSSNPAGGCPARPGAAPLYNGPGCFVSVRVDYAFGFVLLPGADIPMTTTSQMVISQ